MRIVSVLAVPVAALALSGCLAQTVVGIATAPVRAASKAVDLATTSQSESDQKRGRALREREALLGRLDREYRKQSGRCSAGDPRACARRDALAGEIDGLERDSTRR